MTINILIQTIDNFDIFISVQMSAAPLWLVVLCVVPLVLFTTVICGVIVIKKVWSMIRQRKEGNPGISEQNQEICIERTLRSNSPNSLLGSLLAEVPIVINPPPPYNYACTPSDTPTLTTDTPTPTPSSPPPHYY